MIDNSKSNQVSVLVTRDKLYYVVYGEPEVIKSKAMNKATKLSKRLDG